MPGPDPWRKAYTLSRARTPADALPGTRTGKPPPHLRPRRPFWPWLLLILLTAGGAGGWYLWQQRGVLIPKYAGQLPAPVAKQVEQTPLPRQELDVPLLDGGLGIGLAIGGDYLNLIGATRDWDVEWKLTELGSGNSRATAPGLTVYSEQGRIRGYVLDIKDVFAAGEWQPWYKELLRAGLGPELNWRTATGDAEMPQGVTEHLLKGRGGYSWGGRDSNAAYTLYFRDGWLTRVEGGLLTGEPLPEALFNPPATERDDPQQPLEAHSE